MHGFGNYVSSNGDEYEG
jgi:hypothetical protein